MKLSICMIVRDEEKYLDNCLKSLKPLIDLNIAELIIVDTGSIDKTVEIARKYTDKVYFKKWNNSFSDARNYSIALAKGEYIFIMDADQDMEKEEVEKLIKLFNTNEYKNYSTYSLIYKNYTSEDLSTYIFFSLPLIFRNDGTFRYEGKVHNQPKFKEPINHLEVYMNHYGYIMTEEVKERKFKRTATLLKEELKKDPNNIYYIYQLSRSYETHDDFQEAIIEVEKYLSLLEKTNIDDNLKVSYFHNAAIVYFNGKKYEKCIECCNKLLDIDKELIDAYYLIGKCEFTNNNIENGIENFKKYLKYLKNFKYIKYAKTNGLEVFSADFKNQVLNKIISLKLKIKDYVDLEKYMLQMFKDNKKSSVYINILLEGALATDNIKFLDKIIIELKELNEIPIMSYLLSVHMYSYDNKHILKKITSLDEEEKENILRKISLESESSLLNLSDLLIEKERCNNKNIKLEYIIVPLIETLKKSKIEEILNNKKIEGIIGIIEYILVKSSMFINGYNIKEDDILTIFNKFTYLINNSENIKYKDKKQFAQRIQEFYLLKEKNEVVKAVSLLLDLVKINREYSNIINILKNRIINEDKLKENNKMSKEDIEKIKENLSVLISNNMIVESVELFTELEKLCNIYANPDLLSIKAILLIYSNKIDEALNLLIDGTKKYPNNYDLLYNLEYVYEVKKQYLSALNICYDIIKLENGNNYEINSIIKKLKPLVKTI